MSQEETRKWVKAQDWYKGDPKKEAWMRITQYHREHCSVDEETNPTGECVCKEFRVNLMKELSAVDKEK